MYIGLALKSDFFFLLTFIIVWSTVSKKKSWRTEVIGSRECTINCQYNQVNPKAVIRTVDVFFFVIKRKPPNKYYFDRVRRVLTI